MIPKFAFNPHKLFLFCDITTLVPWQVQTAQSDCLILGEYFHIHLLGGEQVNCEIRI